MVAYPGPFCCELARTKSLEFFPDATFKMSIRCDVLLPLRQLSTFGLGSKSSLAFQFKQRDCRVAALAATPCRLCGMQAHKMHFQIHIKSAHQPINPDRFVDTPLVLAIPKRNQKSPSSLPTNFPGPVRRALRARPPKFRGTSLAISRSFPIQPKHPQQKIL